MEEPAVESTEPAKSADVLKRLAALARDESVSPEARAVAQEQHTHLRDAITQHSDPDDAAYNAAAALDEAGYDIDADPVLSTLRFSRADTDHKPARPIRGHTTVAGLRAAAVKVLGQRVLTALENAGTLRFHGSIDTLPPNLRDAVADAGAVGGIYHRGVIHLLAPYVRQGEERGVLGHESWHLFLAALKAQDEAAHRTLMDRLDKLSDDPFFRRANERLSDDERTDEGTRLNELGAYAIEEYESDPRSVPQAIAKWVKNLIAQVRLFLIKHGIPVGRLTPADLAVMARDHLRLVANGLETRVIRTDGRAEPLFTRRLWHGQRVPGDYVVPETPEYAGNESGDLATVPNAKGVVEALPIRLAVGEARGEHQGFGLLHINDNARRVADRGVEQVTGDQAENIAREVVELLKQVRSAFSNGRNGVMFFVPTKGKGIIADPITRNGERFYSVTTVTPVRKISDYGTPEWSGRLTFPDRESAANSTPIPAPHGSVSPRHDPVGLGYNSETFDITDPRGEWQAPKVASKQPTVTVKKKRAITKPGEEPRFTRPTREDTDELYDKVHSPNASVRQVYARNPHLTPDEQIILAHDENYDVRWYLAGNPALTQKAQEILAATELKSVGPYEHTAAAVHARLAERRDLSDQAQILLLRSPDATVRNIIARDTESAAVQADLVQRASQNVAAIDMMARFNQRLWDSTQEGLLKNPRTHEALARNDYTSRATQLYLAEHGTEVVRRTLAWNSSVDPDVQMVLARDADVSEMLAENDNVTTRAQRILAQSSDVATRLALAKNENIADSVASLLAEDDDVLVVFAVARNPTTSDEVYDDIMRNMPALKERAEAKLRALQQDPETNARDLAALMGTGLIDITTIKKATAAGVSRWRRELKGILDATTDADTKLSAVARRMGVPKDALIAMIRKSVGDEVAKDWTKRDFFSRADLDNAAGKPGYLYTSAMKRGGVQAPGQSTEDWAIGFFDPDLDEYVQPLATSQRASGHPPGFGFSLFAYFGDNNENAMMTEIQSDIMSYLFDKDKDEAARQIWGDKLDDAREAFRPKTKTWVKEIFRNTVRYLFNHGVKRVFAITPESLRADLGAHPPTSVVGAWQGEREARAEGFGERTTVNVDGLNYEVWGAIERDSEAGKDILFSRAKDASDKPTKGRPILTDNDTNMAFTLLAQFDEAFQQPTPKGKTVEIITGEINPTYKASAISKRQAVEHGADRGWAIAVPSGRKGYVYERTKNKTVWIDVSELKPGLDKGNAVYGIAAGYAHNAGRTFIGDPMGLSRTGFYRRLENMISSALRYGTTDHLAPHEAQMHPETTYDNGASLKELGIKWKPGDTAHNLTEMMRASYNATLRQNPELAHYVYDFDKQSFVDTRTGRSVARKDLGGNVRHLPPGAAASNTGGSTTAARAIIYHTFSQEGRGKVRPAPLASFGGQLSRGVVDPALEKILYSRPKPGSIESRIDADYRANRPELHGESGHAQPLDAKVLTPSGWRLMGDLQVGDLVMSADGWVTEVTGVYPQGIQPIFRLVFDDGSTTRCTADHLWSVREAGTLSDFRVRALHEIISKWERGERFEVPRVEATCGG
ncbi:MAG: hypothetical protein LBB76_07680 [Azoarcus sp.]|nr:hypothetical protein [Azoarcus sp.]